MKLFITGQKEFGAAVLRLCLERGDDVLGVSSPAVNKSGERPDRLRSLAIAKGIPWMPAGDLRAETLPLGVDLIVAAHSHDYIGRPTRLKPRFGAIGYHPSLLPLHRGRDAIEWTLRMGDPVAGGSIYWLSDCTDAGDIAAQEHVFIRPGDNAAELWRRELFPLGLRLFNRVLNDIDRGRIVRIPQQHEIATWEPSIGRPPLFKPELPQLGAIDGFTVVRSRSFSHGYEPSDQ